jgi:hypothetical protein
VLKPTRAKNARIKAFMIRDIRVIRGQTVLRQSPFANLAPLRETLARQHFRSHRLCIRYIRVIRGQTDARHPPPNSVIFCVIPWPQASPPFRVFRVFRG